MLKMGWIISPLLSQTGSIWFTAERDWKQDCCHSNIKIYVTWRISSSTTCVPNSNCFASLPGEVFSILCFDFHIVTPYDVMTVPNLHNTKILNISGTRWDMTKRKMPFFFTFKSLSNSPIFQYLNFSFHRHFKDVQHKHKTAKLLKVIIVGYHLWNSIWNPLIFSTI